MRRRELTRRQERFVEEYIVDLNAAKACIRAGYKAVWANKIAAKLVGKISVSLRIEEALAKRSKRTGVTADRVVRELARIGFADLSDISEWDSGGFTLKPSSELSRDDTACIAEMVQTTTKDGGSFRVKLHNKVDALKELAKHTGVVKDGLVVLAVANVDVDFYGNASRMASEANGSPVEDTPEPITIQSAGLRETIRQNRNGTNGKHRWPRPEAEDVQGSD